MMFNEPDPDFTPLRKFEKDWKATGTYMVPGDAESYYEMLRGDNPELPEWRAVRLDILESWEWRKGIAEMMGERAYSMFDGMFNDVLNERGLI